MDYDWNNLWPILFFITLACFLISILLILIASLKKVKLKKVPVWFSEANDFKEQKKRLTEHELRIEGTLAYWKNTAAMHHRIDKSRIIWSLFSAISLPVLIQFYDNTNSWSVAFLTSLTIITGLSVSLSHALKSEQMYRGFRECESDYYDLARKLLDFPETTEELRKIQVDNFLNQVELIRKAGRKVETNRPPSGLDNK